MKAERRQGREGGFENIRDMDYKGTQWPFACWGQGQRGVSVDATPMRHTGERELWHMKRQYIQKDLGKGKRDCLVVTQCVVAVRRKAAEDTSPELLRLSKKSGQSQVPQKTQVE